MHSLRWYFNIKQPLGVSFFPSAGKDATKSYLAERNKLHTAVWKFCYFTICASCGCYILATEWWVTSPADYYRGWPDHPMRLN
jgi:hypothetical protein